MSDELKGYIVYETAEDFLAAMDEAIMRNELEAVSNTDYLKWEATLENKERHDSDQETLID